MVRDPQPKNWPKSPLTEGRFGFAWHAVEVERTALLPDGRAVLTIRTDAGKLIKVVTSQAGKFLRVFGPDGREWGPK